MHWDDGPGVLCYSALRISRINIEAAGHTITQHRPSSAMCDNCGRSRKCVTRDKYLISLANPRGVESQMKCSRTGIDSHGIAASNVGSKITFKLLRHWPGSQPA